MTNRDYHIFRQIRHLLQIQGHSVYSQFKICKENQKTKLYVKADELEENFTFSAGIRLLKDLPTSFKFTVSPFRHDTMYSEVLDSVLCKFIPTLDTKYTEEEVSRITSDWKKRVKFLNTLKESEFAPFDIKLLKTQQPHMEETETLSSLIRQPSTSKEVALTATFYPLELSSFSVLDLKPARTCLGKVNVVDHINCRIVLNQIS